MTNLKSFIIATALCLVPATSFAQSQKTDIRPNAFRLTGDTLRATFMEQTHAGAYNFTEKGQPTRFYEEVHRKDGSVIYSEPEYAQTDPGIWIIQQDIICYIYDNSEMPGGCFRVYRVQNCFYFYSDTLIEREDELDRDYWTARSVIKGEQPKCEAAIS